MAMKKGTKQILLIGGLGVGGYLAFTWWQGRQAAEAEAAAYWPSDYGGGGSISGGLGGGMGLMLPGLFGEPCGPLNEGTPEETPIGGYTTEAEKVALLATEAAYREEQPMQFFYGIPGRYLTPEEYARRASLVPPRLAPTPATIAATEYAARQTAARAVAYAEKAAAAGALRGQMIAAVPGAGTRYLSAQERYRRASGVPSQRFVAGVPTRYIPAKEYARRTALLTPPPFQTVGAIAQREAAAARSAASRTSIREATRAAQVAELTRIAATIPSRYQSRPLGTRAEEAAQTAAGRVLNYNLRFRGQPPTMPVTGRVAPRQIPFRTPPPIPTVGALEQMAGVIQYGRPSPI